MTFHRVRFSSELNAYKTSISGPKRALHWLFGPQSVTGEYGLRTRASDVWGGAGFYGELSDAQAVFGICRLSCGSIMIWLKPGTRSSVPLATKVRPIGSAPSTAPPTSYPRRPILVADLSSCSRRLVTMYCRHRN